MATADTRTDQRTLPDRTAPAPGTAELARPRAPAMTLGEIPEEVLMKRYGTTRAELEAVKHTVAPTGTTDYELLLYAGLCTRMGLDMFVPGLVHFAQFEKKEKRVGANGAVEWVVVGYRTGIILGVYGYLQLAQQQKDCDGIEVESFPLIGDGKAIAIPTHATCTIWRKGWSHPLKVTVTMTEKRQDKSKFWRESPRQALETAAIRRGARLMWPALFAPVEDSEPDEDARPEVRGRVGTVLGEHHDTPPLPPGPGPVDAEFTDAPPAPASPPAVPPPAAAPPVSKGPIPYGNRAEVDHVASQVRDIMDDPALREDLDRRRRMENILDIRLSAKKLISIWSAQPEDLGFLESLRDELVRIQRGA